MYAKLFTSIYQGTLRGDTHGLVVFTNLLAHADAEGWVDIHPKAIAEEVGLSIEQVRTALSALESPDPESRSPEEEGRRIVRLDEHRAWGWRIVNHAKYRAIRSEEERREQNRLAQQRWREKHKQPVSTRKQNKPKQKQIHIQKQEDQKKGAAKASQLGLPDWLPKSAWNDWHNFRNSMKGWTHKAKTLSLGTLTKLREKGHDPTAVIEQSIERGWTGLFEIKQEKGNGTNRPAESASGRAERKGNEHLARLEEAERSGNDPLLAAHGRDIRS